MSTIFIPKTIKVGFQKRDGTYTGKLAYVIYFDQKGVLRKQASWESWRDKKIEPIEIPNTPTSGFVLNKKAGGYNTGWNHRQTYCRVFDPRGTEGFEFEITIPNLLFVLENANSIKGKGLEGEFVYGWDGTDLLLIPAESPDYIELMGHSDLLYNPQKIASKELIIGATYITNKDEKLVYIGKYPEYSTDERDAFKNKGNKYWFWNLASNFSLDMQYSIITIPSISGKIIKLEDSTSYPGFADIMDKLEKYSAFSPVDPSKDVYTLATMDDLIKNSTGNRYNNNMCLFIDNGYHEGFIQESYTSRGFWGGSRSKIPDKYDIRYVSEGYYHDGPQQRTLLQILQTYKPAWRKRFLANGKRYKGD